MKMETDFSKKYNRFLAFEKEHDLFSFNKKGVYYWHLIRCDIVERSLQDGDATGHPDSNKRLTFSQKILFLPHVPAQIRERLKKSEAQIFVAYRNLTREVMGKTINPYIDFLKEFDFTRYYFTQVYGLWPAKLPSGGNHALLHTGRMFQEPARLFLRAVRDLRRDQEIEKLSGWLQEELGVQISGRELQKKVYNQIERFLQFRRFYKKTLGNRFQCIITGCSYNVDNMALYAVAHELGIPTVELQHGVIGQYHFAYNFLDTSPAGKYMPDYIFTYGEYWNQTCRLPACTKAVAAGSPIMDVYRQAYAHLERNQHTVIFYSSGPTLMQLSKLAVEFAQMAVPLGYRVKYKLHPFERLSWRELYPWLAEADNLEIIDTDISVYEVMASARYHAGVNSTTLFEAIALGGQVFSLHIPGSEYMEDMVKAGAATYFDTAKELLNLIRHGSGGTEGFDPQELYKGGSIRNIERELKRILG